MTEELVAAQLQALYELGILDRDDQSGEEALEEGEHGEAVNERFLLALAPVPVAQTHAFASSSQLHRSSLDCSRRTDVEKRSECSRWEGSGYDSSAGWRSRASVQSTSRPSEILQRQPRPRRRISRLNPPRCLDPVVLACFEAWKRHTVKRRHATSLGLLADTYRIKRGVGRWCAFLHWERFEQEHVMQLESWKVARACKLWRAWATQRRLMHRLLSLGRRSFASRHRKVLVWRRWRSFSGTEKSLRIKATKLHRQSALRLMRRAWNELMVHAFSSAQARQLVKRCFKRLDRFRHAQLQRQRLIEAYRVSLAKAKLHRVVKVWRMFAYSSGYDRRCIRRVRLEIMRKRIFTLWRQVHRFQSRTSDLRWRVERKTLSNHLCAWRGVNRAMKLYRCVLSKRAVGIRRLLFAHWAQETARERTSKVAKAVVEAMRLSRAVSSLKRLSELSRQRLYLIRGREAANKKRILKIVWTEGWLRFHQRQLCIRQAQSRMSTLLLQQVLKMWMRFHADRSDRRHQWQSAASLRQAQMYRRLWRYWRTFVTVRRASKSALARATSHNYDRQLRRGVFQWCDTVSRNSEVARRTLAVRQSQRVRLKARSFANWMVWAHARRRRAALVEGLQRMPKYQYSTFNPRRKAWHSWSQFVVRSKQNKRSRLHFREWWQQKALCAWHRHVVISNDVRALQLKRRISTQAQVLCKWKLLVDQGLKKSANAQAATQLYLLRASHRVFRSWVGLTTGYLRHVRVCRQVLERQYLMQQQSHWFRAWMSEFRTRQHIFATSRRRKQVLLRTIVRAWLQYASTRAGFRRRHVYFQKVYGNYPRSCLARRIWQMWRQNARRSTIVRVFNQTCQRRSARKYWSAWRCFARYRCMFRAWQATVRKSGVNSASFRVRHARKKHRRRLKISVLTKWKQLLSERRNRVKHFSRLRFQVYLELRVRLRTLQTAQACYSKRWFDRWRFSENRTSVRVARRYQSRLLRKLVQGWWRVSIRTRQEKVLHDAKQIIGALSYYQDPMFEQPVVRAKTIERRPHTRVAEEAEPVRVSSRQPRKGGQAMTDPTGPTRYSAMTRRAKSNLRDERPLPRSPKTIKSILSCSTSEHGNIAAGVAVKAHHGVEEGWLRVRSGRWNENISMVNMSTLPSRQQGKPPRQVPVSKSSQSQAPVLCTASVQRNENASDKCRRIAHPMKRCPSVTAEAYTQATGDNTKTARTRSDTDATSELVLEELPLFDADFDARRRPQLPSHTAKPTRPKKHAVSDPDRSTSTRFKIAPPLPVSNTVSGTDEDETAQSLSLESLAKLDVYGELPCPAIATASNALSSATKGGSSLPSSLACQTNIAKETNRKKPITKMEHPARSSSPRAFVDTEVSENRSLSDILGLRSGTLNPVEAPAEAAKVIARPSIHGSAKRSFDSIITHYSQQLQSACGADRSPSAQQAWRVCFEMIRDLTLLRNDFYISELERIFRKSSTTPFVAPESGASPESDLALARAGERLKLFLHHAVAAHPSYIKTGTFTCSNREDSTFEPLSRGDQMQYPSLQWLIDVHLPLLVCRESSESPTRIKSLDGKYWTRHEMPPNMKRTLDKFIPVVKKYTGVLSQFFARGAGAFQHPTVGVIDPRDYRMSRRAFFALMKQARVFPQLFHRRELESAFNMSVMSNRAEDAVDFPEFVELLARCSSSLQWGSESNPETTIMERSESHSDADTSTDTDTTNVIKFLMLIFAMEGKGSVLRKRSKDLDVVIEFLNHQQQQRRECKMSRFKKLLEQQEAARRAQRKERVRRAKSPVSKVLSHLSPSKRSRLAPVAPSPAKTFDDLTRSWDFEYNVTKHIDADTKPFEVAAAIMEAVSRTKPSQPILPPVVDDSTIVSRLSTDRLKNSLSSGGAERPHLNRSSLQSDQASAILATHLHSNSAVDSVRNMERSTCSTAGESGSHTGESESKGDDHSVSVPAHAGAESVAVQSADLLDVPPPPPAYDSPLTDMSKNEFLDEILTSIGDVELLLHQSSRQRLDRRGRPTTLVRADDTPQYDRCGSDYQGLYPRTDLFKASTAPGSLDFLRDEPPTRFDPTSPSFRCLASDITGVAAQFDGLIEDSEDVHVKDAMLDYLTDAARFSETDQAEAATITAAMTSICPADLW